MRVASILPILAMVVSCLVVHTSSAETPVDYNRDVRPLLSNHCYQCHGPDNDQRVTDMRLDQLD